jgi:hypothetical protein
MVKSAEEGHVARKRLPKPLAEYIKDCIANRKALVDSEQALFLKTFAGANAPVTGLFSAESADLCVKVLSQSRPHSFSMEELKILQRGCPVVQPLIFRLCNQHARDDLLAGAIAIVAKTALGVFNEECRPDAPGNKEPALSATLAFPTLKFWRQLRVYTKVCPILRSALLWTESQDEDSSDCSHDFRYRSDAHKSGTH